MASFYPSGTHTASRVVDPSELNHVRAVVPPRVAPEDCRCGAPDPGDHCRYCGTGTPPPVSVAPGRPVFA